MNDVERMKQRERKLWDDNRTGERIFFLSLSYFLRAKFVCGLTRSGREAEKWHKHCTFLIFPKPERVRYHHHIIIFITVLFSPNGHRRPHFPIEKKSLTISSVPRIIWRWKMLPKSPKWRRIDLGTDYLTNANPAISHILLTITILDRRSGVVGAQLFEMDMDPCERE